MSERAGGIRRPLANAGVYSLVQRALGAEQVRREFVREHLRAQTGERILDLGCGPGEILALLPAVDYLGVDRSAAYISAAHGRFGDRGRFVCADVREVSAQSLGTFDAVVSVGVLHHLDDTGATGLAALAARVLDPRGRLVSIDPALAPGQPSIARWLIGRDRGRSVRTAEGYRAVLAPYFETVDCTVRHDLARVPYTHAILAGRAPQPTTPSTNGTSSTFS
jgi:SAM-dependent methyltransferase